jgi:pimeloyl-ACP methyl ester carboxylesterase
MREHAVSFGAGGNLSGILCEPDQPVAGAPAALMWNVGIHHRVGAFRIWVDLARRLAAAGFTSLRFDLSGMGDSETRRGAAEDVERKEDLDEAMAFITKRTGLETFAPIAFCSGIDQLHALGLREPRVVAMAYIEGYAWRTRGFYLRYPLRYLRGTLWRDRLEHLSERKELQRFRRFFEKKAALAIDPGAAEEAAGAGASMFARHRPDQAQFSADLRALRGREVKLFFAYFGLETDFSAPAQFEEMTGVRPDHDVRLFFLGGADHILYRTQDRALTVAETAAWLKQTYAHA